MHTDTITQLPLVSAIITTHNRLPLLKRAIAGVRNQTYPNIELIVVDDASEDGTAEFCNASGIRCIHIPPGESKGSNHARNVGLHAANGIYVAFCDDDDYWLPEKTDKQVKLITSGDFDFVHCGRRAEIVRDGKIHYTDFLPSAQARGDISKTILYNIFCFTITLMIKREALLKAGLFDERLKAWQEYELSIRLAQHGETDYVNEVLCVYRVDVKDPHRLTNKYFGWLDSVRLIYRKHHALYSKLSFREKARVKCLRYSDGIGRAQASGLVRQFWISRINNRLFRFLS